MNKKNILIVDDEIGILIAYKKLLTNEDTEVQIANTLEQAEELLKINKYDAVIADLRLTGILGKEGLDLIRYVKEHSPETKCILITAYGSPEIEKEAYNSGASFYFEKPLSPNKLINALIQL